MLVQRGGRVSFLPLCLRELSRDNSVKYILLLKENLIADLDEGDIFQHNEAQCHRLHESQQSLADEDVTV